MRSTSAAVTLALATATILGGVFLFGRSGVLSVAPAMAQAGCCGTPAPVSSILQDAPAFTLRDPAHDTPSASAAAVCATPAISTGGYRTLIVHVANCTTPVTLFAEYSLGQTGFVTLVPAQQLACIASTTPGVRGAAVEFDATLGTTFRIAGAPNSKGACPVEPKITVAGVR
jgi:hypothetical protein